MVPLLLGAGLDPVVIPTVQFGQHPGRGTPGGGPVGDEVFRTILDTALHHPRGAAAEVWCTGYFASAAQVRAVCEALDAARRSRTVTLVCDPVTGDADKGRYVDAAVAAALKDQLVRRADWLTPNSFEAAWLSGVEGADLSASQLQGMRLSSASIITSVARAPGETGLLVSTGGASSYAGSPLVTNAPHGMGDILAAMLAALLAHGLAEAMSAHVLVEALNTAREESRHGELSPSVLTRIGKGFSPQP